MGVEFRYPTESGPTASWLPSKSPTIASSQDEDDNFLSDLTADGRTLHHYELGDKRVVHRLVFVGLTQTDKANFETFRAAALGNSFRFIDDVLSACGTTPTNYKTVKVAIDGTRRRWKQREAQQWDVELAVQEV